MRISKFLPALFLLLAIRAYAQSGCTDSPECPTAILALVGSAGFAGSRVLARLRTRR